MGLIGFAGRASAVAWDLRVQFPPAPCDKLDVSMATHGNGDVAARVTVRFDEIAESLRLIGAILSKLPAGDIAVPIPQAPENAQPSAGWKAGAAKCWSRSKPALATASAVCIRTIRRGTTGRCSSGRCSATSFRIFRSSTSRSTCHTAAMICNHVPAS